MGMTYGAGGGSRAALALLLASVVHALVVDSPVARAFDPAAAALADQRMQRSLFAHVPAAFGPDIGSVPVTAVLVEARPRDACGPLRNGLDVRGKIALVVRGGCNFTAKVMACQLAGAAAVLVADDAARSWAVIMHGEQANTEGIAIPSAFVSWSTGRALMARWREAAVERMLDDLVLLESARCVARCAGSGAMPLPLLSGEPLPGVRGGWHGWDWRGEGGAGSVCGERWALSRAGAWEGACLPLGGGGGASENAEQRACTRSCADQRLQWHSGGRRQFVPRLNDSAAADGVLRGGLALGAPFRRPCFERCAAAPWAQREAELAEAEAEREAEAQREMEEAARLAEAARVEEVAARVTGDGSAQLGEVPRWKLLGLDEQGVAVDGSGGGGVPFPAVRAIAAEIAATLLGSGRRLWSNAVPDSQGPREMGDAAVAHAALELVGLGGGPPKRAPSLVPSASVASSAPAGSDTLRHAKRHLAQHGLAATPTDRDAIPAAAVAFHSTSSDSSTDRSGSDGSDSSRGTGAVLTDANLRWQRWETCLQTCTDEYYDAWQADHGAFWIPTHNSSDAGATQQLDRSLRPSVLGATLVSLNYSGQVTAYTPHHSPMAVLLDLTASYALTMLLSLVLVLGGYFAASWTMAWRQRTARTRAMAALPCRRVAAVALRGEADVGKGAVANVGTAGGAAIKPPRARPEHSYGFDSCCAVCLDDFAAGDEVTTLPCAHEFHSGCIRPWLEERSSLCPMCKRDALPAVEIAYPHVQHRVDEAIDLWREHGGGLATMLLVGVLSGGLALGALSLWLVPAPTSLLLSTQQVILALVVALCCLCFGF